MIEYILSIGVVILFILVYISINLLRKNERHEEDNLLIATKLTDIREQWEELDTVLLELDKRNLTSDQPETEKYLQLRVEIRNAFTPQPIPDEE